MTVEWVVWDAKNRTRSKPEGCGTQRPRTEEKKEERSCERPVKQGRSGAAPVHEPGGAKNFA